MKIAYGLPALLLGTTLLAGSAFAQPQQTTSAPPPHFNWNHSGRGANANAPNNPPPNTPAPRAGRGHFAPTGNNHFGQRGANNSARPQMHWNHAFNSHDRNVAHFNAQDRSTWTGGHWRHERHNGRNGWWWNAGGAWFFYDQPVYPYPGYVSDDYTLDDGGYSSDAGPNPYDDQSGYTWYYCQNPAGYYPYIQSCRGPWQPVDPYTQQAYDQGQQQGATDADDDDRGPPPGQQDQYHGQMNGPQQGYDDDNDGGDEDQGPPPGYNGDDRGPPPGYNDQGPPPR